MFKRHLALTALVLTICLAGAVDRANADSLQTWETSSAQEVVDGMAGKMGRGIANVATGWLEFPKQIAITTSESGAARGATIGPLKGIGMLVVRTVTGVLEIGTFFIPNPGFYDPYFDPAYVWRKE